MSSSVQTAEKVTAAAQSTDKKITAAEQKAKAEAQKPLQIFGITVSGSIRTRIEDWDFFNTAAGGDHHYTFTPSLLRLSLSQNKKFYDWQLETALPILPALPSTAVVAAPGGQLGLGASYFAANGNRTLNAAVFVKQAFIRFRPDGGPTAVRFGRFEFLDGVENKQSDATLAFLKRERLGQRLLGNFGFTHVGRSFDGAEFKFDGARNNLTFMAGRATRGVFQTDGTGELDVDTVYGSYTRQFTLGGKNKAKKNKAELRVFGMMYHDGRPHAVKVDNRSAPARAADHKNIRIGTYGAHYVQTFESKGATADILLWGALQYGSWGMLPHRAAALSIEGGVQPHVPWKPWLRAGYDWASGTGSATPTQHGTFLFPLGTPRIYARFPFYNSMNLGDAFGMFLLRPHPKLTLRTEFHNLQLASASDLWYSGGGAFQQGTFGIAGRPSNGSRDLGNVADFGVDWNVRSNLTLSGYYGYAWGGTVVKKIFANKADAGFAYLEMTYRF